MSGQLRKLWTTAGLLSLCAAMPAWAGNDVEIDFGGYIEPEVRIFMQDASDPDHQEDANLSVAGELELEVFLPYEQTLVLEPFARVDLNDDERTHWDVRRAFYERVFDAFELRIGFNRVFWGRTEAAHLIDIVNQTDAVENVDGEEKLGQPMVNVSFPTDFGLFDFYWLPYFRERTFEGINGRPRIDIPIREDLVMYEEGDEETLEDFAVRWSHYYGPFDFGLAYFNGTGRDPVLTPTLDKNGTLVLAPYYPRIEQVSVDFQATFGPALYKFEGFRREQMGDTWMQASGGIEYTFYQAFGGDADLGIVAEYIWDERGESGMYPFQNDAFFGARWTANDVQSTAILAGTIVDVQGGGYSASVEAERRIGEDYFLSIEGRFFFEQPVTDPLYSYTDDDFLQLRLARYF